MQFLIKNGRKFQRKPQIVKNVHFLIVPDFGRTEIDFGVFRCEDAMRREWRSDMMAAVGLP